MKNLSRERMSQNHREAERNPDDVNPKIPGIDSPGDKPRTPTDPSNQPIA